MKIWIHLNGAQEGPFELYELPLDRMDALTPVWHEGMATWQPASQVPIVANYMAQAALSSQEPQPQAAQQYSPYPRQERAYAYEQQPEEPQKAPASYLGWSIAMTVLCCNPIGIVPIITGVSTRSKFGNRDYKGARRMSETTAWWVMITIVTSLMLTPFAMLFS